MNKKGKKVTQRPQFERPVDQYFYELDQTFTRRNKAWYAALLTLTFFGVMGLVWMIPFPKFDFLVQMNAHTFLNWGSFYIAIIVYCYLKLAPTLSYIILFCIAIMSYFIVQLEYVERDGGPTVVLICTSIAAISLIGLWLLAKNEKNVIGKDFIKFLTIGPIWLWSKVFQKLKWKY
jgi:hypothetical protein